MIAKFTGRDPGSADRGKERLAAQIEQVAALLGLNKPYWQQYLIFMSHLVHGNFGFSYVQMRPVSAIMWPAARATASLVLGAAVVWLLIAAPVGALRRAAPAVSSATSPAGRSRSSACRSRCSGSRR